MTVCDDILLKQEIVVMEDDLFLQQAIKEAIKKNLPWEIRIVGSEKEAISLIQQQEAGYYILDVHMGSNREQEGLDALEKIKGINSQAFVSILSAYPNNRRLAENLDVDIFIDKTPNIQEDIRSKLIPKMLQYRLNCLQASEAETRLHLEKIYYDSDVNIIAYERLKSEPAWLKENEGQYVAFVDGEFVGSCQNKQELLQQLREKYPEKSRFFKKVDKEDRIIDIPYFDIVE
ncbi:MAG: response regulator [Microcystis sp. M048S1]|jgi:ActR/RegA family two-component response regulator|uniref:Response regulatory domain-containing protein n=3 Tax=Microcystis aeruginosa TaxID=1126 RepID=I4I155_MICAE|nr:MULTISPECIES: response regulator [Microcystis]MCA2899676.1 response regulator [Microcystis sp. M035S1]MCE2982559.1 response regulator [Parachlamydia sp.]NCQ99028.1 response regulator [Microcystis aeruginosa L211-11]NCR30540.1 response regulator [Microcystis aeruginosa L211-101]NCS40332.1 response regulator [Microcystis aeruginosa BS13-10]